MGRLKKMGRCRDLLMATARPIFFARTKTFPLEKRGQLFDFEKARKGAASRRIVGLDEYSI